MSGIVIASSAAAANAEQAASIIERLIHRVPLTLEGLELAAEATAACLDAAAFAADAADRAVEVLQSV